MPLSEWIPCNELMASAKFDTVLFVIVAFNAAAPSPASLTMPRSSYCRTVLLSISVVCEPPAPRVPIDDSERLERTGIDYGRVADEVVLDAAIVGSSAATLVHVDHAALTITHQRYRGRAVIRDVVIKRAVEIGAENKQSPGPTRLRDHRQTRFR